jgi:hypothetical protein
LRFSLSGGILMIWSTDNTPSIGIMAHEPHRFWDSHWSLISRSFGFSFRGCISRSYLKHRLWCASCSVIDRIIA